MNDELFFIKGAGGAPDQPKARVPVEVPEGISGQSIELSDGSLKPVKRAVSLTQISVSDLISEGEIEGLVTGEYSYVGTVGKIGYDSVSFNPYSTKLVNNAPISYLRSIFWNETPIVDKDNLFNFQQINVGYSNGVPNGSTVAEFNDELTISRNIQERLRGPNSILDNQNKIQQIGEVEQFAKYYRILNKNCIAANINIRVNALSKTIIEGNKAGDITATNIKYRIYYKPLFSTAGSISAENSGPENQEGYEFGLEEEINGKISYGYIRSSRVNFKQNFAEQNGFVGWAVKIFRLTPDSLQGSLLNQTYIDSLTEIYNNSYCYPNSAIVFQKFSAEYFSQIPNRAFDVRLLKVKIPSNYNPVKKEYIGEWDGTWKTDEQGNEGKFWTDNPAWCFYDIVTNQRYGLGKYIDSSLVDKWSLYEIAQYCDTLVSDGLGGVEPRFTCNLILNSREEAYKVLNDMASIFRAMIYYFAGGVYTSMDTQKNPIYQFTNANVENGDFRYSTSSKRVRHSACIVRYNDKTNFYKPAVEYIEDVEAIKQFGYRELDISAFGCTSRGQAIRYGRWVLLSENLETETVSFSAGLEGNYLRPGDIFSITDKYKNNIRVGGRVVHAEQNNINNNISIILDDRVTGLNEQTVYSLYVTNPTYNYEPSQVSDLNSSDISKIRNQQYQKINFSGGDVSLVSGYSYIYVNQNYWKNNIDFGVSPITKNSIWSLESSGVNTHLLNKKEYYRVIKIEEKEENIYNIDALQYNIDKYNAIDSGLNFQNIIAQVGQVSAPEDLQLTNVNIPTSNLKGIKYSVIKNNLSDINGFLIYARLGPWEPGDFSERFPEGNLRVVNETPDKRYNIDILSNSNREGTYIPFSNGTYYFRAYSRNALGVPSATSAEKTITIQNLNNFPSLIISSLRLQNETDSLLQNKEADIYTLTEPSFTWQSTINSIDNNNYSIGDLYYRITLRKTSNTDADNPATIDEKVSPNDPYSPSKVIYYERNFYKPDDPNNPIFKFDLKSNLSSFLSISGYTGVLREYDVVVESHLINGDSSAGGNISGSRGGIRDSSFANQNKNGWDILYVNNPKIPSIQLSQDGELNSCLALANQNLAGLTALNKVCSEQWIESDGVINLKIHTNNLPSDIVGGFIFSCKESFTQEEAFNGKKNNGQEIYRSEFAELTDPIISNSLLKGYRSGFMAVSFYDELDKSFRDEMLDINPNYNTIFISGLNMSNVVAAKSRGISEDQSRFLAWANFLLEFKPENTRDDAALKIEKLEWQGAGIIDCNIDGFVYSAFGEKTPTFINVKVNFDPEILISLTNKSKIMSYYMGVRNLNNSNQPIGETEYIGIYPAKSAAFDPKPIRTVEYREIGSNYITFTVKVPSVRQEVQKTINSQSYLSYEDVRLEKVFTSSNVFIGLTSNENVGSNVVDVSQWSSVKNRS